MLLGQPPENPSAPQVVVPEQFNAATALLDRHITEGHGARTAVHHEGTAYTYAQIAELANRIGNALLDLGIDLEQRVALLLLDSPHFAAAFFAAMKIGSGNALALRKPGGNATPHTD